jgi:uncharacterized protein DUF6165
MLIGAPISVGELIDKITILQIKLERLEGPGACNVAKELAVLNQARSNAHLNEPEIAPLMIQLRAVNVELWDIEDQIRQLEACKDFGPRFIDTARSVYRLNDEGSRELHRHLPHEGAQVGRHDSYKRRSWSSS